MVIKEKWTKLGRGVYESSNGRWRVINPWQVDTSLRWRWIVQERSDGEWWSHDNDYATMREAREYAAYADDDE
jgi:hypothetical protein